MSDTKAWEVDTCRGHFNNVCVSLFHPRHELILSVGEDKTIRVWDMGKRTAIQTFRREHDRFWSLIAHPELNLFAAGAFFLSQRRGLLSMNRPELIKQSFFGGTAHDNGVIVFKLERERPAFSLYQDTLFYVQNKMVRMHDLSTGSDVVVTNVKKLGPIYAPPLSLSYNPAEKAILVSEGSDGGVFEMYRLPQEGAVMDPNQEGKRGQGSSMLFVARNRFAVFSKQTQVSYDLGLAFERLCSILANS
jgi:coatomer protein complex subunit alpha (xenin)